MKGFTYHTVIIQMSDDISDFESFLIRGWISCYLADDMLEGEFVLLRIVVVRDHQNLKIKKVANLKSILNILDQKIIKKNLSLFGLACAQWK